MANKKNTYPDWAEKFRTKGKTIRKVRNGYGLYECTSEYVKGGYPKTKQKYLGMITEKDGFIPKKTDTEGAVYLEYGLSHLVRANFHRYVMRHICGCSEELYALGVIQFMFGDTKDIYLKSSYATYSSVEGLCLLRDKITQKKISSVSAAIERGFAEKVPEDADREMIRKILMLCVVESGPRSVRKPSVPKDVSEMLEKWGLKF